MSSVTRAHGAASISAVTTALVGTALVGTALIGTATPAAADPADPPPTVVVDCAGLADALLGGEPVVLGADLGSDAQLCPPVTVGSGGDNTTVVLDLADHSLYVGTRDASGGAGIFVPEYLRLEIHGVTGETASASGELRAFGGAGAGIGAEPGSGRAGPIDIYGGWIFGSSATGAGIGGSDDGAQVYILGGHVEGRAPDRNLHPAADSGAGIGGGRAGDSRVAILRGTAYGESWSGAGIGGGVEGQATVDVTINGAHAVSGRPDVRGISERGAGLGGGEHGTGTVFLGGGFSVGAAAWTPEGTGVGIGDPGGHGVVSIGNDASVVATSIRSLRTNVLGGSLYLPGGVAAAQPRVIDNYRPLVPVWLVVRENGVPVNEPGLRIELLDTSRKSNGYYSPVVDGNFSYVWLRPTLAYVAVELRGVRKVFPVVANGDQATPVFLDFGTLTKEQRAVAAYYTLYHSINSPDAFRRIAEQFGVSTATVREWVRRAPVPDPYPEY